MKTIYFKHQSNPGKATAIIKNEATKHKNSLLLENNSGNGVFSLCFDNDVFDSISFSLDRKKETSKLFPGNLSIGVEYKYNDKKESNLTYLFSGITETGKVENHVLKDEANLAYRADKSKKISIFLPSTYDGNIPHDVLYFFDAQNLFCNAGNYTENGDPYGSWQLDVVLSEIYRQYGKRIIVVGIDNADEYRSRELFMSPESFGKLSIIAKAIPDDNFSKGYLDNLSAFIVGTLHDFIKEHYCIYERNIGIGGSSMGGIAAFYCGLRELGFFKYVLSYSPAYGLYQMNAFSKYFEKLAFSTKQEKLPKIHIYCGGGDALERMLLPSAERMKSILVKHGYNPELVFETYDKKKPHNEESWRLILPESFSLLLDLKEN